jgi:hypothetical protein
MISFHLDEIVRFDKKNSLFWFKKTLFYLILDKKKLKRGQMTCFLAIVDILPQKSPKKKLRSTTTLQSSFLTHLFPK